MNLLVQLHLVLRLSAWRRLRTTAVKVNLLQSVVYELPKPLCDIVLLHEAGLRLILHGGRLRCRLESNGRGRHRPGQGARSRHRSRAIRSGSRGAGSGSRGAGSRSRFLQLLLELDIGQALLVVSICMSQVLIHVPERLCGCNARRRFQHAERD